MSTLDTLSVRANHAAGMLRSGTEAGALIDQMWRDLQTATNVELEDARGVVIHALSLLGPRGAHIANWMSAHSLDSNMAHPVERMMFWNDVTRNLEDAVVTA